MSLSSTLVLALILPLLHGFVLDSTSNVSAVFLTCCDRHTMLRRALADFEKYNDYPLNQVILVNDGHMTSALLSELFTFRNLTVLTTGQKVGQLAAIDMAYQLVTTPYVLLCEDDRWLKKKGLIAMNVRELENDRKLLQMWNDPHGETVDYLDAKGYVRKDTELGGFSLEPSVNRMSLYRKLPDGYAGLTKNISFATGAEQAMKILVDYYRSDYRVKQALNAHNQLESYFEHADAQKDHLNH